MKKILVIEDEEIMRENILKLLKAEGFDVTGAENGARGMLQVRSLLCNN